MVVKTTSDKWRPVKLKSAAELYVWRARPAASPSADRVEARANRTLGESIGDADDDGEQVIEGDHFALIDAANDLADIAGNGDDLVDHPL